MRFADLNGRLLECINMNARAGEELLVMSEAYSSGFIAFGRSLVNVYTVMKDISEMFVI